MLTATDIVSLDADGAVATAYPGVGVRAITVDVATNGIDEAAAPSWAEAHARWHDRSRGEIRNDPRVGAYRELSGAIGVDPDRQAPSIQALIDRGLRAKALGSWPRITPVVDAVNAVAVSRLVALGVFDADRVSGEVRMTVTVGGEPFRPLGADSSEPLLPGRLVLADAARVLSLFAHRDGVHQAVTAGTRRVLLLGCVVPGVDRDAVDEALTRAADVLTGAGARS